MTTPRIDEIVGVEKTIDEEIDEVIDALIADVHFEKTWPSHTAYYQIDLNQFKEKLCTALTQAHQAGIDETGKKAVTLFQQALGDTELPEKVWKKIARVNQILLDK